MRGFFLEGFINESRDAWLISSGFAEIHGVHLSHVISKADMLGLSLKASMNIQGLSPKEVMQLQGLSLNRLVRMFGVFPKDIIKDAAIRPK